MTGIPFIISTEEMDGSDGRRCESKEKSEGSHHGTSCGAYEKRWEETGGAGQMSRSMGVGEEEGRWRSSRTRRNMDDDIRCGFIITMSQIDVMVRLREAIRDLPKDGGVPRSENIQVTISMQLPILENQYGGSGDSKTSTYLDQNSDSVRPCMCVRYKIFYFLNI